MDHSLNIEKTKENISNQKTADNVINLSELKPTQGFAIKGIQDADSGIYGSVSEAGDVNGDGYQDIIIGAPDTAVNNKLRAGHVYVIFGHENQTSSASLDVNNLDGSDGFVIEGLSKGYRLGESVSNAGDVNHDGIDDLLLGIPYAENNNQERSGKTYLLFGDSALGSSGTIDLSTLNNNSVVFQGGKKGSYLGISVSAAGDFNADGIDDIIISSLPSGEEDIPQNYVIFGNSQFSSRSTVDLSTLDGSNGLVIVSDNNKNDFWHFVSDAGDVNGDGIDDIIIGSENAGDNSPVYGIDSIVSGEANPGRAYVIFGSKNIIDSGQFKLSKLDGSNGFVIKSDQSGSLLGSSVSSAGDINNDGIDDLIIGAYLATVDNKKYSGESYIIFGDSNLGSSGKIDILDLNGENGFRISGINSRDALGFSVSSAGDFNQDNIDDLAIIAPGTNYHYHNRNRPNPKQLEAEGYIIFGSEHIGSSGNFELSKSNINNSLLLQNYSDSDRVTSQYHSLDGVNKLFANTGDVNQDGISDIIIGRPSSSALADSYIVFGSRQYGVDIQKLIMSNE